jgi:hypothetical protein
LTAQIWGRGKAKYPSGNRGSEKYFSENADLGVSLFSGFLRTFFMISSGIVREAFGNCSGAPEEIPNNTQSDPEQSPNKPHRNYNRFSSKCPEFIKNKFSEPRFPLGKMTACGGYICIVRPVYRIRILVQSFERLTLQKAIVFLTL